MLKIKEKFQKLIELSKDLLHRFPATIFIVAITTLFITICIDTELDDGFLERMLIFLASFFAGTFFTESLFKKTKWKIISFSIAGCISIFFGWYLNNFINIPEFWELFYIGYVLVLMLIALYCILKRSKLSFQEYITKVFSNMFFVSIVYCILAIGISLISWIFIELILDGDYGEILLRANLLLFGFYYITGCIYAVSNVENKEVNLFIKNLIKFVLTPLVGIAMAIIYLYILKIFITGEMPSNVIFRICAILFVFAFPIWNMFEVVRNIENKISRIFSYAYIPLLILEIYSLIVRISSLGLTPVRYFGIFFIIFQIISLVLNFFWDKEKLPKLIVCAAILIALFTMTPMTPSKVSALNQLARLTKYLPENVKYTELSNDVQEKVTSAYRYMLYDDDSNRIPGYIKNQENDILNYSNNNYDYDRNNLYYSLVADENIKVAGFNYITKVYSYGAYNGAYTFDSDVNTYSIDEDIINDYIRQLIKNTDISKRYHVINTNPYLDIDNMTFYFTGIEIVYNETTDEIEAKSIDGYVLE